MKRRVLLRASAAGLVMAACGGAQTTGAKTGGVQPTSSPTPTPTPAPATKATVELTKGGSFTFALRADKAPQTVARFVGKAGSGFYDNLTFHRVEDWVVQGGDPDGRGTGGGDAPSEYNDLPFALGAVGIARGSDRAFNNDSQFFVVKEDTPHLNGDYTNFGLVSAAGMDVVKGIKIGDRIKKVTVE